jgi:putative Holliday junction resolvase
MGTVFQSAEDFFDVLPETGALLGLDVGTRTVGLAVSDGLRHVATAHKTLERKRFHVDSGRIATLSQDRGCVGAVVGLPVNMDGAGGPRVQASKAYARNVAKALSLPVLLWDERLSTVAAERSLLEADMSRARRAEVIDSVAAAVILQGALDRLAVLSRETSDE